MRQEFPFLADATEAYALGDVWSRPGLDNRTRQLAAVAAFAAIGATAFMKVHAGYALNIGVTEDELKEIIYMVTVPAGFPRAIAASQVLRELFAERRRPGPPSRGRRHEWLPPSGARRRCQRRSSSQLEGPRRDDPARMLRRHTAAAPYVGMWVTADGHIRHGLLPNGRYDEARGTRESAYRGRYEVRGNISTTGTIPASPPTAPSSTRYPASWRDGLLPQGMTVGTDSLSSPIRLRFQPGTVISTARALCA